MLFFNVVILRRIGSLATLWYAIVSKYNKSRDRVYLKISIFQLLYIGDVPNLMEKARVWGLAYGIERGQFKAILL